MVVWDWVLAIEKIGSGWLQTHFRGRASRICWWLVGGQDGKERGRDGTWGFNLSNQGDGGALTVMGRTGVFFGHITFEIPIYDLT